MFHRRRPSHLLALGLLLTFGCGREPRERPVFALLPPAETGITFANTVTTNDSLNVVTDVYVYNGAGVAIGDVDNDGLSDVFLSGNMVSSRLYRNRGQMRFDDITQSARVGTDRWATGVTMVDVNDDGYLDIYVSVSGRERSTGAERANLLFVNNGDRTFTERASQYGVADTGFTTHSAFLDYDGDGCIDLFVLNNSPQDFSRAEALRHPTSRRGDTPGSYNQLYRGSCRGRFTNVSLQAGILRDVGYGLGVVVADVDRDGRPDIYVSNDASPNDVLYVNNGNGTFTDMAGRSLRHASLAGMGVDIADFNNDGWPDILQVDMLPPDPVRRKRMSGFLTYNSLLESRARGVRDDYSANTLQLSNGVSETGDVSFSEIARLAGVAGTDWSWSALFADFDNDGLKDIFISNGYPKAVNDYDYQLAMLAARRAASGNQLTPAALGILNRLHSYRFPNHVFRNGGDLTFADKSAAWGLRDSTFAYGAAYGDLDNDGRLDLVVNNIDAPASVYHNVAAWPAGSARHFLQVRLQGETPQRAIGARIVATAGGVKQHVYHNPARGFMSSMDDRAHFGLGGAARVDTLEVWWPDGRHQLLTDLEVDRTIVVRQRDAGANGSAAADHAVLDSAGRRFVPWDAGLSYLHRTGSMADYSIQALLPYMLSRQGPSLAVADVDGDSLQDVFVSGGWNAPGRLFIQRRGGGFTPSAQPQPWGADSAFGDWGAHFFDANGDGRPDLYVASGGYHLAPGSPLLQDRLYINQGSGRFERDAAALPQMLTSTAAVRSGDFTGDGRPDLFVGGRLTPRGYPAPTRSYLLRNDGGRFVDVTREVAPELIEPGGMVTDAVWVDFDGDKRLDLVTAGEWMPLEFYRNDGRRLRRVTGETGLPPLRGWWFSLAAGDFDRDGRPDLVAGNLGLNHSYTASAADPFGIYAADFTGSRSADIILTEERNGVEYPYSGLVPLGREIYPLALRYRSYEEFARTPAVEMFGKKALERAIHYQAETFASGHLRNLGGGRFGWTQLPNLAQIAPIRGIIPTDVDGDGHLDAIVAGNLYDVEANTPRADAGSGLWLRGDGQSRLAPIPPAQSGLFVPLNVSGLALIDTPRGKAVIVANTGDSVRTFLIRPR